MYIFNFYFQGAIEKKIGKLTLDVQYQRFIKTDKVDPTFGELSLQLSILLVIVEKNICHNFISRKKAQKQSNLCIIKYILDAVKLIMYVIFSEGELKGTNGYSKSSIELKRKRHG